MDDDGFVSLPGGRWADRTVPMVNIRGAGQTMLITTAAIRQLGSPERLCIKANPTTGDVRLLPTTDPDVGLKVSKEHAISGSRIAAFCKTNGFAFGRYPAEIRNGMVVFRLTKKTETA